MFEKSHVYENNTDHFRIEKNFVYTVDIYILTVYTPTIQLS